MSVSAFALVGASIADAYRVTANIGDSSSPFIGEHADA